MDCCEFQSDKYGQKIVCSGYLSLNTQGSYGGNFEMQFIKKKTNFFSVEQTVWDDDMV